MKKIFSILTIMFSISNFTFANTDSKRGTYVYVCDSDENPVENYELVLDEKYTFYTNSNGVAFISLDIVEEGLIVGSKIGYSRIEIKVNDLKSEENLICVNKFNEILSKAENLFFEGKAEEILSILPSVSDYKNAKLYSSAFYCMYNVLMGNEVEAMDNADDMYLLGIMPEKFGKVMAEIISKYVVYDVEIDPDAGI